MLFNAKKKKKNGQKVKCKVFRIQYNRLYEIVYEAKDFFFQSYRRGP